MRFLIVSLLSLAFGFSLAPAYGQDTVRAPAGPDPYQTYTEAAAHLGQKAWLGTRDGTLERITLRLGDRRYGISLELPPGAAAGSEVRLTELIRAEGWDPGTPRRMKTDHGPVYTFRPPRMTSTPSWNQIELRLELDPLVKGLEDLGGKPRLFAVRTPESLEWSGSPAPDAADVFKGERFAFYTLKPSGNEPFMLKGGVNRRRLLALLTSIGLWLLFPLLTALAARFYAGPPQDSAEPEKRWRQTERALCWITALGAFATLSLLGDVLRQVPLVIPRMPSAIPAFTLSPVPFAFVYFYWCQGCWRVTGPAAPPLKSKAMLGTVGMGIFFMILFAVPIFSVSSKDPFQFVNRIVGGFLVVLGGSMLASSVRLSRTAKEVAAKAKPPRPVSDSEEGRRALLSELAAEAENPDDLAAAEAVLEKATPQQRRHLDTVRALTPEEKSWLGMAELLSRKAAGNPGVLVMKALPVNGAVFVVGGIGVWFLPGILGLLLMMALSFGMVPVWKLTMKQFQSSYTKSGADLAVARLLDDPQRYVAVLRRLEEATATEKGPAPGDLYGSRRRALEEALRQ